MFGLVYLLFMIIVLINGGNYDEEVRKYNNDIIEYNRIVNEYDDMCKRIENEYHDAIKEFNKKMMEYESNRKKYVKECEEYREKMKLIKINEEAICRKCKFSEWNNHRDTVKHDSYSNSDGLVKKGPAEDRFFDFLRKDKGITVFNNIRIRLYSDNNDDNYYYPDILMVYRNMYIDIEIDEPYEKKERIPIHYINNDDESVDSYRNAYMCAMGLEVMRFDEKSIVTYPDKCLCFIKKTIDCLFEGKKYNSSEASIRSKKWTYSQAEDMARRGYRDNYLDKYIN